MVQTPVSTDTFSDPEVYESWYHTKRGRWIGDTEWRLLMEMLRPRRATSCLDVGCGSGYFSRRLADADLTVTALDANERMLAYARAQSNCRSYVRGDARRLPFADGSFDYCVAVTSLCFVPDPGQALREMMRVARHKIVLGLLNHRSLLYRQKSGRGSYAGARWDRAETIQRWLSEIDPLAKIEVRTAIFCSDGSVLARAIEWCVPTRWPWGAFLAISCSRI
jgi:SAM-dependent methyltransferase